MYLKVVALFCCSGNLKCQVVDKYSFSFKSSLSFSLGMKDFLKFKHISLLQLKAE